MKTVLKTAEEKMEKSLDAVARDFASVRAGRARRTRKRRQRGLTVKATDL